MSDKTKKSEQTQRIKSEIGDQALEEVVASLQFENTGWEHTSDMNEIAVALYMPEYEETLKKYEGDYLKVVDHFQKRYPKAAKSILTAIALARLEERR